MKVKIAKRDLTQDELVVFNKPKKVYIPLVSGNDKDITTLVKKGEYVYKGSIVAKRKGDLRIPIHSSVSGTVVDFVEKTSFDGEKVKCIMIENDFKEKTEKRLSVKKEINKYTKDDFIENIKENGIVGLGGDGFPTYLKYSTKQKITLLIVNAVECEPYITADFSLCQKKCEEILETIDAILEINRIEKAVIVIRKDNVKLIEIFNNFIGTYLRIKIKLVSNSYPIGWERSLVFNITGKHYNKAPMEKGIIVNNVSTIYAIYESLKYNKPLIERIVTFSGEKIDKKCNVLVKVGTLVSDVLNGLGVLEDNIVIAGGPMMGKLINDDAVICTSQNGVLLLNKINEASIKCINCGKCVSACPAKLSPVLIMKCKSLNKLSSLHPEQCMECGLCSYVCPSKIDVRECVKTKKEVLKGDK